MNPEKPTTGSRIPDLYELLNLPAKENDEQAIKAAMREFADRVKQIKSPEPAKQAAKLFAIAKQNLLEPTRKAAYDSLWDKVYGNKLLTASDNVASDNVASEAISAATVPMAKQAAPTIPVAEQPKWDLTELHSLLPQGDANAPLDLAAFLDSPDFLSDQRSTEDLDRDFQRLLQLLGGEIEVTTSVAVSASAVPANSVTRPFDFSAPATVASGSNLASADPFATSLAKTPTESGLATTGGPALLPPVVNRPTSTASGSRKKRKNRDRPLLLMIGGGITVLLGVLGVLVVMLNRKLPTHDTERVLVVAENSRSNRPRVQGDKEPRIKGSGLPQPGSGLPQPGEGSSMDGPALEDSLSSDNALNMEPVEPSTNTTASPMPEPSPPPTPSAEAAAETPTMTMTPGTTAAVPSAAPPTPEPEKPVSLTDQEKAEWKKLLRSARLSLGKSEFDKARKSLDQASGMAKSSAQQAQLGRLNTIFPLVERFQEAMKSAASELGATEVFKAGTQDISFVEATNDLFIVRIRGANKRYQWDEVPIILAYGLADLELDQSPQSAATKAAFAAVHSKLNGTAKEEARKLMQAAAAANFVPVDTHEVFDDDYSLD